MRGSNNYMKVLYYCIFLILMLFILQGNLECDSDTVFQLAAFVMQAVHGDFSE